MQNRAEIFAPAPNAAHLLRLRPRPLSPSAPCSRFRVKPRCALVEFALPSASMAVLFLLHREVSEGQISLCRDTIYRSSWILQLTGRNLPFSNHILASDCALPTCSELTELAEAHWFLLRDCNVAVCIAQTLAGDCGMPWKVRAVPPSLLMCTASPASCGSLIQLPWPTSPSVPQAPPRPSGDHARWWLRAPPRRLLIMAGVCWPPARPA